MSPYCRNQVDSCPGGSASVPTGGGLGEGARSSSNPESHNLDMNFCFLQRALWRSDGGAAVVVRVRLWSVPEPSAGATILIRPPRSGLTHQPLRQSPPITFPGAFPPLHPQPSLVTWQLGKTIP